jgi:hypothetical protein
MKFDNITAVKTLSRRFAQEFHINPLNAELNPICHLLALSGAHPILHVSRIRVNTIVLHFTAGDHLAHYLLPLPNLFCFALRISAWDSDCVFNVAPGSLLLNSVLGLYYGLA